MTPEELVMRSMGFCMYVTYTVEIKRGRSLCRVGFNCRQRHTGDRAWMSCLLRRSISLALKLEMVDGQDAPATITVTAVTVGGKQLSVERTAESIDSAASVAEISSELADAYIVGPVIDDRVKLNDKMWSFYSARVTNNDVFERCEWDPASDRNASDEDGCRRGATVLVGTRRNWHLCKSCADLPRFARFKKQPLANRREQE